MQAKVHGAQSKSESPGTKEVNRNEAPNQWAHMQAKIDEVRSTSEVQAPQKEGGTKLHVDELICRQNSIDPKRE